VPFTPWTTLDGYLDLLRVIAEQGVIENVAPIQLGIRLLIPEGSRMLELEEVRQLIEPFNPQSLAYPWKSADRGSTLLSEIVQKIAAAAERQKRIADFYIRTHLEAAHAAAELPAPQLCLSSRSQVSVPFLSEPWYCCAEPTQDQWSPSRAQASRKKRRRKRGRLWFNHLESCTAMTHLSKRLLLFTAKLGYQTRSFEEAARELGVRLVYVTDRCHQLEDPWAIKRSPCISKLRRRPPTP